MSLPAPGQAPVDGVPEVALAAGPPRSRRRGRLGLVSLPVALLLLAGAGSVAYLWAVTPSTADLPARIAAIAAASDTRPLRPSEVPLILREAVIAAEDERFLSHHGIDTIGTARAAWDDLTGWCACEGGSSVTQQLAKNVYYPTGDRVSRKLPEMVLAFKIELRYSKAQIMAAYLSVVPTGYGLVGARAASCAYFGHDLASLSTAQAAELAGMLQAPSLDDPRLHPDRAAARRDYALQRMVQVGSLTARQAQAAMSAPVLAGGAAHEARC